MEIITEEDGDGINLYKNSIESPPYEIVKQGKEAIKKWFEEKTKK
jgi:hypothetical protein